MSFSKSAFYLSSIILIAVTLAQPRFLNKYTEATLAWDVSGYYLYLPAIFIHKDLKKLDFLPGIIETYRPSSGADQAFKHENGSMVMKYPAGMSLLYFPFFLVAHFLANILGYPADGFSLPYQVCIHLGGVVAAIIGLWFLRKNLLYYFDEKTTGITVLLIALATNFLNYSTYDAANPHGWLFAIFSLLIYFTIKWHELPTWKNSAAIGICVGLAALVRPTELIFALVPICWGLNLRGNFKLPPKLALLKTHYPKLIMAAILTGMIGFIQLLYWKYATGHWFVYSYQDQGFSFLHPHFSDVFFSYKKGWLLYTPVMGFALLGFYFLWKNHRSLFLPVLLFFGINTWIVCSWDIWWYGGAFGQRAMIQSYPLLAFPLAAFLAWMLKNNWSKWVFIPVLIACTALNMFQTYQAHNGPFETEMMNRAYYWRIFASTKDDPYDKLLLDCKERYSGEKKLSQLLRFTDFESFPDTVSISHKIARSGAVSQFVGPQVPFSTAINFPKREDMQPDKWLAINASFFTEQKEWEVWRMPQLIVRFEKEGQVIKERAIRPFRVVQNNEWREAGMDIQFPKKDFDNIKIFMWNADSGATMYMDDLHLGMRDEG